MPTKFERERDAPRPARIEKVSHQIKETDRQMSREQISRETSRTLLLYTGDIEPDPDQPRRLYEEDKAALEELVVRHGRIEGYGWHSFFARYHREQGVK
jgi:DNA repair exonuclease SbcCD nuclease subunit